MMPSSLSKEKPEAVAIGIMGTPLTSGNRGVQALGAALIGLCLEASPGARIVHFGSHPNALPVSLRPGGESMSLEVVNWRMKPAAPWTSHLYVILAASLLYRVIPSSSLRSQLAQRVPWIGELERMSIVGDIRGGDSFSDIYGLNRFMIATLSVWSVILVKRSIVQFPQTYGPYKGCIARFVTRRILRRSSVIIARDTVSQSVAQNLAGPNTTVRLSPDVAFALYADKMVSAELDGVPGQSLDGRYVGLNVNGLMYRGGYDGANMFGLKLDYPAFLKELVAKLLTIHPGKLLLIPHTYASPDSVESDNEACRLLKDSLPAELRDRTHVITGEYDAHQLKGIIRQCEFFVGSRMHSCIAALSQCVPCVGVAYSMKFQGVFASVDAADAVVDGRTQDTPAAVAAIIDQFSRREESKKRLAVATDAARQRLREVFASLIGNESAPAANHDLDRSLKTR